MITSPGWPPAAPASERQVLEQCIEQICRCLPPRWTVSDDDGRASDARVTLRSPDGDGLTLVFEARRSVDGRDVPLLAGKFEAPNHRSSDTIPVVAARYLPSTVRDRLRAAGLSYVDATGNIWLVGARPGLFILTTGADSDPWRGPGRPRGTLKGEPAAKVVRTLLDLPGPWTARQLIEGSRASVGATYRVLEYLDREGLIDRSDPSAITVPSWRALLEAWARDYSFFRAGAVSTYLAPRGLPWLLGRIGAGSGVEYAITGSLAVPTNARYAPSRAAMIYVDNAAAAQQTWDLRPTQSGQNVLLCEAPGSAALLRAKLTEDPDLDPDRPLALARPAQVAVDLMGAPGRGPEEAVALLEWMERNEPAWRD